MNDFQINENRIKDVIVLRISGMLDAHTTPKMEKALEDLLEEGYPKIVINLKNLDYISSAGLGVFMAYLERTREKGGDIKFCEASEKIYGVFDLLGFPVLYEFYENEKNAVEKFGQ